MNLGTLRQITRDLSDATEIFIRDPQKSKDNGYRAVEIINVEYEPDESGEESVGVDFVISK
jgi:hypothetical protein